MHILQAWKTEHRLFHALLNALDLSLVQTRTKRWNDDKNKTTNNNNNSNNDVNDGAICSQ